MKSSNKKETKATDDKVSQEAVVENIGELSEKDEGSKQNSNGKRLLESNGSAGPMKKKARSFAVHVESVAKVKAADAEGNAPKKLGESPALLKTHCKHEISLPPNYPDNYDFSAPITETLGGEAVSSGPAKKYKFNLDAFQRESVKCLERRESVLVAAHTSAGKTAVAEYAIAMSLRDNQRVIYTSPIKALSNQKFRELEAEFSDVGLMTGDVTINKNASCLVMTTEILRSMLYRGSEIVREVAWVIFDEVHYMRDKDRGVVWEEAIILVPKNVRFVFLSATIPNAREFSEWIAHLKNQPCHTIYTDTRPVPLQHYMVPAGGEGLHLVVDDKGQFRTDAFEAVLSELKNDEGDGGGGKDARRPRRTSKAKKAAGKSDINKVVTMIKDRSMYPVIVFSFSRRDCETMAMQMSKLEFNDDTEKALVEKVYMNAIASLNDEDQDLPQIAGLLPLLKRGVGIHHSGLLPIGKEIVEILFQEGLIKALFATETFAMGVNMPAKTVVFSAVRKFDGKQYRCLLSGEYVQMSGRAGRRGQDEQGIAILICDEKLEAGAVKNLMSGSAEPLNSTFHLGYNMLLNLLRAEEADPEFVIARSLAQFQADRKIPAIEEKIELLKKKKDDIKIIPPKCKLTDKEVEDYFKLTTVLEKYKAKFRSTVHTPRLILPFLQGGRIVRVHDRTKGYDYGWGAVSQWKRKSKSKGSADQKLVVEVLLKCKIERVAEGEKPRPAKPVSVIALDGLDDDDDTNTQEWMIVSCSLADIDAVTAVRIHKPGDLVPYSVRKTVGKSVCEVVRRFPDEMPMLDPFADMGMVNADFAKTMKEKEALEEAIKESPVYKNGHSPIITRGWEKKSKVEQEIRGVKKELKIAQGLICREDLKKMKAVLRRLGFTTEEDIVEVKGRVACEVHSAHELVITEFLLGGNMNELTPEVLVAVLSCFVVDESKKDEELKLEKELENALDILKTVAKRVAKVLTECNIPTDMNEFVESFNPVAMSVVYRWCHGDSFQDVCKLSDIFEGSVVRCLRRLEELLRQLVSAAKSIGNSELEDKFEAGSSKLKRGIAFSSSLYT